MQPFSRVILAVVLVSLLLASCAGQPEQPFDYDAYCWLLTTEALKLPREPWVYYLNTTCGTYEVPRCSTTIRIRHRRQLDRTYATLPIAL